MITPKFSLSQTDTQLIISVVAPYTNVKDTEIHVEGDDVRFFSKPYYLRLTLPGQVEETDNSSAKWVADENTFIITLDKVNAGEHFEGLDMISTLLQPKGPKNKKFKGNLIEVMEDETVPPSEKLEVMNDDDWYIDQEMESARDEQPLCSQYGYGFGNNHRGLGTKYEVELGEVAEIKDPDRLSPGERLKAKDEREQSNFSDEHYLSDLMLDNDIPRLVEFHFDTESLKELSTENYEQMKKLGNREFLLDKAQQKILYLGLVDVLFAYCCDWRTTEGSHTIESPWNISRISGTLSWFVSFSDIKDVVQSCLRRSLSYPLCRNWELSMKVFQDTIDVLKIGPQGVLVCLLDIMKLFNNRDPYYILNQLYIEDYAVWVQKVPTETLTSLASTLEKELKEITKASVRFDLPELELAAKLVEDEEMEEELAGVVKNIDISNR